MDADDVFHNSNNSDQHIKCELRSQLSKKENLFVEDKRMNN